ncbi:hypothetical protein T458_10205 [Brevibacillus panacihumi W25]|uniref:Uncharacterized protein n=1 Tax=Brevibacillus panacihumi W25 TaxID=1408254 RepID=V6MI50_9BACL|nr:hypothetical protein T458_10205 [Brevibacillus panacihumi W25]
MEKLIEEYSQDYALLREDSSTTLLRRYFFI